MVKIDEESENTIIISKDIMTLMFAGVTTLLEIDSLNLKFKENLDSCTQKDIERASKFAGFVIQTIPVEVVEKYDKHLSIMSQGSTLYYIEEQKIHFDPLKELSKDVLDSVWSDIYH